MKLILGIDEVGRGPWAGPLAIGACILNSRYDENDQPVAAEKWQEALKDSKKLSNKKREELDSEIRKKAIAFGLGWVSANELDEVGLSEALNLATRRAIEEVERSLATSTKDQDLLAYIDEIIIDGTKNFLIGTDYAEKVTILTKADDKIKEVSAASILAKVARDNYMIKIAEKYPEYGFENHVGYGTAKHRAALEQYGVCPEHRLSFRPVAKIGDREAEARVGVRTRAKAKNPEPKNNTTARGQKAENIVAEELVRRGHKILARNYKTKFYEIDVISATKDHIYFTEVKYRRTENYGDPLEFIDKKKMTFAAELFMKTLAKKLPEKTLPSPILAAASVTTEDFALENWLELED